MPSWSFLSVQEPREETLIYDVDVVTSNAMNKSKKHRAYLVIGGLFLRPLGALLGPGGQSRGETLSKQVYLGRFFLRGAAQDHDITLRYGSALRPEGLGGRI